MATPVDVHKLPLGDDMYTTNAPKREPSDPAYEYDRNPNSISEYGLQGALSANPKRNSKPSCVGGTIGVMKNGVPLFSAFDAGGRDAIATDRGRAALTSSGRSWIRTRDLVLIRDCRGPAGNGLVARVPAKRRFLRKSPGDKRGHRRSILFPPLFPPKRAKDEPPSA